MRILFILLSIVLAQADQLYAQCCAGGGGCSVAGGISQGVLQAKQFDLNNNLQYIYSDKFFRKDSPNTENTFDNFSSLYDYFRLAYGVSEKLMMSVETGYYFQKKETGLNGDPLTTYESSGIGDLILFPRYDIINHTGVKTTTEVMLGLGYKIPLGSYNDSIGRTEPFSGNMYYVTKPSNVQLSTGSQDILFTAFLFRGFTEKKFRIFANALYVKKGWNPNGEKFGDYASVAFFAGKTFFDHLGVTLQARYEWLGQMKINQSVFLYGKPSNYFPEATGYKKVFITPQMSYDAGRFSFYLLSDFPVYQYLNTADLYTQVGSQHQTTFGISYKFFVTPTPEKNLKTGTYYCPMHPLETSDIPGQCPICGMDLVRKK